ncbi:MAG: UDP-N-acetylglucosamine 1-carboxyvinyltransferase [Firmicutes bacterium]|nr:UDP-N-acetylglucosamine 1-carboxyvinyltransferase [Bacillota bacterium]
MSNLVVNGGRRLNGYVRVSGSKNASVAVIPAALLASGESVIDNLPDITDVAVFANIIYQLGAEVSWDHKGHMVINPNGFKAYQAPYELVKRLRASYYLLGVLLAKFGRAEVALPGGCDIGLRPVDQHLKGFRALGADARLEHGIVKIEAKQLKGAPVYLDVVSVGATINIMLAATLAQGTTVIENAAKEPHVVSLANYLNSMGAKVQGAGTDVIRIKGVKSLSGSEHSVVPDEIEAATFMMSAVASSGDVTVGGVIPKHLDPVSAKLKEAGAEIHENGDSLRVVGPERPRAVNVKTLPYPGFPTDCQQPFVALMTRADGISVVQETIYDNRFGYANELMRMGASIKVDGRTAIVEGVPKLFGAPVKANDLRAGAALIMAGLAAEGRTEIYGVEHIFRGYENVVDKFKCIGAHIQYVNGR